MINEDNNTLDLSRYFQFGITLILIVIGLLYLVKNTAAKHFVEYVETSESERMPGLARSCDLCAVCGSGTTKHCARCKAVKYCSASCQRSHWYDGHKEKCGEFQSSSKSSLQRRRNSGSIALVPCTGNSTQIKKILFPYDEFVELFNWKQRGFPPCGLLNCGNSCFANVVLQCLTYTRPLAAYLLEKGHRRECRRNYWCFLCELQAHMERACRSNHAFSPINILSRLPNIGGNLGYGKQEDAHEFMRFAIDTMQSVCLDEYGGEKAVHPSSQETTLIQHIFGGRLQSQVICTNCNNVSNQFENMMDLTVEIHGDAASLEECLDQFTVKEWLEGDNKYKCDGCNDYVLAWKRLNINTAPNILTIALKRFQSGRFGKLNKRVAFPETLDLSPYMSEAADGNDKYMLYGVVVHVDMLNASYFGHYICYMKDFSGNWYRIDDCKVDRVELDEVLSQGAYMLLYSRVSARRSCLKPIVETSKKEELQKSNTSQENTLVVSQPLDCTLTAESADTTSECGMDLSPVLTSPKSSDSAMDIDTVDTKTGSVSGDDEVCDNGGVVPIEEATLPVEDNNCFTETSTREYTEPPLQVCSTENDSIQNHVSDNIQNASSSSNGEDANGMDSTYLGCKPEKPESTVTSAIGINDESRKPVKAKLKPLIAPGFLGKRPRKIVNTKKDAPVNVFKNIDIAESNGESVMLVNGDQTI
ncbi:ubiquitin carboxyl-terminal hydrolase 18-like protein [Tanacetum coccineum]